MNACSGLDAGFFIGRDNKLIVSERLVIPTTVVEVKDTPGFKGEVGVTWKDPCPMLPGTDGILVQPSPERASADACHQPGLANVSDKIVSTPARERKTISGGQFTSQRLNLNDELWGKKSGVDPDERVPPNQGDVVQRIAFATLRQLLVECSRKRQSHHCSNPGQQEESSWPAKPEKYGNVYLLARLSSSRRSAGDKDISKGLFLGMANTSSAQCQEKIVIASLKYVSVFLKQSTK